MFRDPSPWQRHVVDWIQLPHWPVFNLADCSVVCGGALVIWASFRGIRLDGTLESEARPEPPEKEQTAEGTEDQGSVER
ncbi:signal peptidase II [Streptomyces lancefieldiae]|uniref:Signal peptidase II n=1 Tax=Streptomyces lancefieldiae TaxID=3075520 RepID=A0ABU3AWN5_9ACTN|nr:signal peptidase II [Streptomyces sp. DSM 40712]MDT0614606.1 signal peptidase II [Streptomyces sp. DSM 40712]